MDNQTTNKLEGHLCSILPAELTGGIISNLKQGIEGYQTKQYDITTLSSGKFVEFSIRALEFLSSREYTPLSKTLKNFSVKRLDEFARLFDSEPCRTLIPKALFSMYCIRNKRGGIHVTGGSPNRLDAAKLVHDMRWITCEFVSTIPDLNEDEIIYMLDSLSSPLLQIVWDVGNTKRVLYKNATCLQQILLLLYSGGNMSISQLREAIEYKNTSRFKNNILCLHKQRLINCHGEECIISPLGVVEVKKIINKFNEEEA